MTNTRSGYKLTITAFLPADADEPRTMAEAADILSRLGERLEPECVDIQLARRYVHRRGKTAALPSVEDVRGSGRRQASHDHG